MLQQVNQSLYGGKNGRSAVNFILNLVLALIGFLLVFQIAFGVFYQGFYIVHSSMSPTLTGASDLQSAGGDYIYVNRYAKPGYGDIVVVFDGDQSIVKRLIAFGGDTVKIERGVVYVRYAGEEEYTELSESYVAAENNTPSKPVNNFAEHTVAEGCYFLLGDNRDVSSDSRQNGDYSAKGLIGVMPAWAMSLKPCTTALHNFFQFTLPRAFGMK